MHLRLAVPSLLELTVACSAAGVVNLCVMARSFLSARRPRPPASFPSFQVVVPCKGVPPGLEENAATYRALDYPGQARVLFVVPDRADPAWEVLSRVCAAPGRVPASVAASQARPERCSGKAADLVWALRTRSDGSEAVAFADADQAVSPDWLTLLASALAAPGVGVATSAAVPAPRGADLWASVRMLWVAWGLPYFDAFGMVCGQSAAARRADLAAWGVAELWERVVLEDLALAARARSRGARVAFLYDAMPADRSSCGRAELWPLLNKWTMFFRVYDPRLWLPGLAVTAFKTYALWRALRGGPHAPLLAALWLPDALYAALALLWLRARRPANFAGYAGGAAGLAAWGLAAGPLIPLAHLLNFASSLGPARVRWGGRTYRLLSPSECAVEEAPRG